ncbi:Uncharacterized protein TCM_032459 [Theobroma cacao]|uniref:Ubiquitin-like protease family profile domain-containing protein n=1 Tax=Theobroma cacao TaxID=3641 RepID=A0A061FH70_THECC|nr:Uncharacterized protein TCM_032459 [Theobroma cacao]
MVGMSDTTWWECVTRHESIDHELWFAIGKSKVRISKTPVHANKAYGGLSRLGLGARENKRKLKEKIIARPVKRRCTVAFGDDELSGLKLIEEGDNHGNVSEQPLTHADNSSSTTDSAAGDNVTHVDDDLDDVVEEDFHLVEAKRDHVPKADAVVEVAIGGDGNLASVEAEGDHVPQADAVVEATAGTLHQFRLKKTISNSTGTGQMANKYMASPYVNPLVSLQDLKNSMVEAYEVFKKDECVRCNVGILGDQGLDFFTSLEDSKEEMTSEQLDTCLNVLCWHTKKKWKDVDFILTRCNVGEHWVVAKIDLIKWRIKVVNYARTLDSKDNKVHATQMTSFTMMMHIICH